MQEEYASENFLDRETKGGLQELMRFEPKQVDT